jgi:4-oxalocrotonate tautomerase
MPHICVKLAIGKSQQEKTLLAQAIIKDVINVLHSKEEAVSLAIEEIDPAEWTEKVYRPDIQEKWSTLYKKPGYEPPGK